MGYQEKPDITLKEIIGLMNWGSKELSVISPSKSKFDQVPVFFEISR